MPRDAAGAVGYVVTFPPKLAQSGYQDDREATHVYCFYVATLLQTLNCAETNEGLQDIFEKRRADKCLSKTADTLY
jgi:hypothetical protein